MKVREIVTRVKSAIDELSQDGTDFAHLTEDEQNLTRIIIDKIGYALVYILENAPLELLGSDGFKDLAAGGGTFTIDAALVGKVTLPADLLRIVEARLSSWSHFPLPVSYTSDVALMQADTYARGSWDRPVNVLTHSGSNRYLEMYCAKEPTDTLIFTYVGKPDLSGVTEDALDVDVAVPAKLEAAMIYQVAGLTMTAFREEIANNLFAIARSYMGGEANAD